MWVRKIGLLRGEVDNGLMVLVSRKGVMVKIQLENSRKIWGTLRSTTSAAILNVVKRTTTESLADRLSVKRKYKMNANGSVGKWWFVVRGDKNDIDALVEAWDRISFHTAWRLEGMFSYVDDDLSPISPGISTSTASVLVPHLQSPQQLQQLCLTRCPVSLALSHYQMKQLPIVR